MLRRPPSSPIMAMRKPSPSAPPPLQRDQGGEVLVLAFSRREAVDHPGGLVGARDNRAGGGAAVGHRLHDHRRPEPAKPDPAAFLADVDGAEAELGRLADRVARE